MAKKRSAKKTASRAAGAQERMLELVHQVYLAGLGAVATAQKQGPKVLDELVREGARLHADTKGSAEKALRSALGDVQSTLTARMAQVRGQASDAFENLEKIFQTRVHRALTQLGVPSAEEVKALSRRVEALNGSIEKLARARRAAPAAKPATRPAATVGHA